MSQYLMVGPGAIACAANAVLVRLLPALDPQSVPNVLSQEFF